MNPATHRGNIRQAYDILTRYGEEQRLDMPHVILPTPSRPEGHIYFVPCTQKSAQLHAGERQVKVSRLWPQGDSAARHSPFVSRWEPEDVGYAAFALEKGMGGLASNHWLNGVQLLVDVYEGGVWTTRYAFKGGRGYVDDVVQRENIGRKMTRTDLRQFGRLLSNAVPVTA